MIAVSPNKGDREGVSDGLLWISLACFAAVIFGIVLARSFTGGVGHDQISYLCEARRFLSGAEIYGSHLVDSNPPVIIWFSCIPVLFGKWAGVADTVLFRLLIGALIAGSVAWCIQILRHGGVLGGGYVIALLGLAILVVESDIWFYDFGQREHLFVIFAIPYLLAVATGATDRLSRAERCALGVAAALAVWFKPHEVLVLAALELFLWARWRSLRRLRSPEMMAFIMTCLAILAVVGLATPLYFTKILPVLSDTYWGMGTSTVRGLARSIRGYSMVVFLALALCFLLRRKLRDWGTTAALLLCSFAGSIAYDVQHTDWPYHRYPYKALLLLAIAYLLLDVFSGVIGRLVQEPRRAKAIGWATLGATALYICALPVYPRLWNKRGEAPEEKIALLTQLPPSTTVYVFSTSVPPLAWAYTHHLNWGSRFAHLWMLPAIIQNELGRTDPWVPFKKLSPERLAALSTLQRTESAEDLGYFKPAIVLVQHCTIEKPCQGIEGKNFDMLAWFMKSPEFAAQWAHYQPMSSVEHFDAYRRVK